MLKRIEPLVRHLTETAPRVERDGAVDHARPIGPPAEPLVAALARRIAETEPNLRANEARARAEERLTAAVEQENAHRAGAADDAHMRYEATAGELPTLRHVLRSGSAIVEADPPAGTPKSNPLNQHTWTEPAVEAKPYDGPVYNLTPTVVTTR